MIGQATFEGMTGGKFARYNFGPLVRQIESSEVSKEMIESVSRGEDKSCYPTSTKVASAWWIARRSGAIEHDRQERKLDFFNKSSTCRKRSFVEAKLP